jgi:hypothetical protein
MTPDFMAIFDEPRTLFIALMLICPTVAIINSIIFGNKLKQFVRRMRMLSSYDDILYFQRVVSQQMYAALFQIVLLAIPAVLYVVGALRGYLTAGDLIFVILPSFVVLFVGLRQKQTERQVRVIPARDRDLERQRDEIVTTWVKRALPDW